MNIGTRFLSLFIVFFLSAFLWGIEENKEPPKQNPLEQLILAGRFADLAKQDQEKIIHTLSGQDFAEVEELLFAHLKMALIKKIKPKVIESYDLLAAFLAYYKVVLNAGFDSARSVANDAIKEQAHKAFPVYDDWLKPCVDDYIWSSLEFAAWDKASIAFGNAVRDSAWGLKQASFGSDAWNKVTGAAFAAASVAVVRDASFNARGVAKPPTDGAFEFLKIKDVEVIGKIAYKFSTLYVLAYLIQDEGVSYFEKSFLEARRELKRQGFSMSPKRILAIIAAYTWAEPSLLYNLHIGTIMGILREFAPLVRDDQAGCCLVL